jgi:hypothetical protein
MQDYWWYLRLGKDIVSGGIIPNVDTYSYTHAGEPIINLTWLSAVFLWLTYSSGGITFTFLLRGLLIGLTYGLLWILIRQCGLGVRIASLLVIAAGLSGSNNWSLRPQMFILPIFVLTLLILWEWQYGHKKIVWVLPIISVLWANLHGSFLLIFILVIPAILFGKGVRKTLIVWTFAAFLTTFINPYGYNLWTSVLRSLISPHSLNLSTEWFPPTNQGWQMNIFFGWLLLLIPLASISTKKLGVVEWLWLLGLGWLSLSGLRFVIWELFIFTLCTAQLLTGVNVQWIEYSNMPKSSIKNFLIGLLILTLSLIALPGLREKFGVMEPSPINPDTPIAAATWLADHDELPGPIWNDVSYGSYLIFALPSRPVWIDTRFEMIYPASEYLKFREIARADPAWENLLLEDGVNLLFLSLVNQPRLVQTIESSNQWCEQYRDDVAVIFSRCERYR